MTLALARGAKAAATLVPGPVRGLIASKWFPDGLAAAWAQGEVNAPLALFGYAHEFASHDGSTMRRLVQRHVLGRADACLAIARHAEASFLATGVAPERVHRVGIGVDASAMRPAPDVAATLRARHQLGDRRVVLTMARLVPHKGHLTVLRALPAVLEHCPEVTYVIAGTGPWRPQIEKCVATLGLGQSVLMLGRVPPEELAGYHTMADLMVMASEVRPNSLVEGFGLVFLEANCCGTPVIGSYTGGIPEAVVHGGTGLLVPPEAPEALAAAMLRLLRDPELSRRMGTHGRERALAEFRWPDVAERVHAACSGEAAPYPREVEAAI